MAEHSRTGYCQECDSLELFSTVRRVNANVLDCEQARGLGGDPHYVDFICGHRAALVVGRWKSA